MMQSKPRSGWVGRLLIMAVATAAVGVRSPAQPRPLTPIEGFESRITHLEPGSPFALRGFAVDPANATLYLSVSNRILRRETNGSLTELVRFPISESTGLFSIRPSGGELLYTNFSTFRFYRRKLSTGITTSFPGVKNSFDVVITATGELLVSANPNWPAPGAETSIYLLDPLRGKHRELIRLTGPSGPLVFTKTGDLLYALQSKTYPSPRGGVRLIRFTSQQISKALAATTPLPISAGSIVLSGLDGAADLAFDDRGRLYISDPQHGGIRRTWPGRMALEPTPMVRPSALVTLGLAFVDSGTASMDSYQPASGAALYVSTTDWSVTGEVRCITPRRPLLQSSPSPVPRGPFQLHITQAPANAAVWLGMTLLGAVPERPLFVVDGVSLFLGLDFLVPPVLLRTSTDNTGAATFKLTNPGGLTMTIPTQALLSGPAKTGHIRIGTSKLFPILIKP